MTCERVGIACRRPLSINLFPVSGVQRLMSGMDHVSGRVSTINSASRTSSCDAHQKACPHHASGMPLELFPKFENPLKQCRICHLSFFSQFVTFAQISTHCLLTVFPEIPLSQWRSTLNQIIDAFSRVMTPSLMPAGPDALHMLERLDWERVAELDPTSAVSDPGMCVAAFFFGPKKCTVP